MFMTERMKGITKLVRSRAGVLTLLLFGALARGDTFRVATYNLEGYFDVPTPSRVAKSVESKAKIRESILALKPDVLALQEVGSMSALLELRDSLKSEGVELPHWQFLSGTDTNIHIALLSKFPFAACRSHTNESYLLTGRRFHVSRGFAEVDINVTRSYSFTLIAAHLKSKRALAEADESEMRLEEAKLLREKIDARLSADPDANLVVLGDFNDTKDSASTRAVIGRGKSKLVDTRPAERNGDDLALAGPPSERRCITWTHYYGKEDSYRRIDFLLLSRGMAREWIPQETYLLSIPRWGLASDHRPLVAAFNAEDR
jgi:endonuclease/exonuclease/phosphatase family metal-dependent hydrolase